MKGVKSLLSKIEKLKDAVSNGVPDAIEKEVERVGNDVEQRFMNANYYGNNDTTVSTESTALNSERKWAIIAAGESVLFIEYGSGINLKHNSDFAGGPYAPASWSATHSEFLTDPKKLKTWRGWWPVPKEVFNNQSGFSTEGNPSNNIMYNAIKTLRDSAPRMGKRELKKALK